MEAAQQRRKQSKLEVKQEAIKKPKKKSSIQEDIKKPNIISWNREY